MTETTEKLARNALLELGKISTRPCGEFSAEGHQQQQNKRPYPKNNSSSSSNSSADSSSPQKREASEAEEEIDGSAAVKKLKCELSSPSETKKSVFSIDSIMQGKGLLLLLLSLYVIKMFLSYMHRRQ